MNMSGVGEGDGGSAEAALDLRNTDTSDIRSPVLSVQAVIMSEVQLEPTLADSSVDFNENPEVKEPNSEVENSGAVSSAEKKKPKDPLLIPEILSKILQNYDLKFEDLKSCRVVSSLWNGIVESKFVSKSTVKLRNDLEMSKLNTVLEKADYFPFGHLVIACGGINWPSFAIFFSTYGDLLHTLTIESENTLKADGNPSINGPGIFAKVMHMLKTAPNLTTLNIGEIVTGPTNGFNNLPAEIIQDPNFDNLKQIKRLHLEVAARADGTSFSSRVLYKATNVEELSLVGGTLVQSQPRHVKALQPVEPMVQPAVEPLQPLGQLQPCLGRLGQGHGHRPVFSPWWNAKFSSLAKCVRSEKIKKLKLRGIPTSFLTQLNLLPVLEELQMENSKEDDGAFNIFDFLVDHANHLKKLVLKNAAHFSSPENVPLLPKLEYLVYDVPEQGLPLVSVSSDMVPALTKIKTTPSAVTGDINGFFHSVREIEIYEEEHAQQWRYVCPMPRLSYLFTNLKALRFTEVRNEMLSSVFQFLQQLEELTVTCYQLNESTLTGINRENADWVYTRFLKDKNTAEDIQDAARPHLYSVTKSPYCLRGMTRLKKFRIAVDGWPGKTIMSDACIFLSFMLMQPLEVLAVNNIQLPDRGAIQMQQCVQKVYMKFSDEPGFNLSD